MALLGTGILKGPFTDVKEYHSFDTSEDDEGNVANVHVTKVKSVPSIEAVSCWIFIQIQMLQTFMIVIM